MSPMTPDVAFFLIFVGVLIRMIVPALRKKLESDKANEAFKWSHRYTYATVFSLVVAFAATVIGFTNYVMPPPDTYWLVAYCQTMAYGFFLEAVVIEVMEWTFEK